LIANKSAICNDDDHNERKETDLSLHCNPSVSLIFAKIFTTDFTDHTDEGNAAGKVQNFHP
jgi:hypothetical protein